MIRELLTDIRTYGLKFAPYIVRSRILMRMANRMGGHYLLFVVGKNAMCATPNFKDGYDKDLAHFITLSLEHKDIHDVVIPAVADYLRPLEVETKMFMDLMKKEND